MATSLLSFLVLSAFISLTVFWIGRPKGTIGDDISIRLDRTKRYARGIESVISIVLAFLIVQTLSRFLPFGLCSGSGSNFICDNLLLIYVALVVVGALVGNTLLLVWIYDLKNLEHHAQVEQQLSAKASVVLGSIHLLNYIALPFILFSIAASFTHPSVKIRKYDPFLMIGLMILFSLLQSMSRRLEFGRVLAATQTAADAQEIGLSVLTLAVAVAVAVVSFRFIRGLNKAAEITVQGTRSEVFQ